VCGRWSRWRTDGRMPLPGRCKYPARRVSEGQKQRSLGGGGGGGRRRRADKQRRPGPPGLDGRTDRRRADGRRVCWRCAALRAAGWLAGWLAVPLCSAARRCVRPGAVRAAAIGSRGHSRSDSGRRRQIECVQLDGAGKQMRCSKATKLTAIRPPEGDSLRAELGGWTGADWPGLAGWLAADCLSISHWDPAPRCCSRLLVRSRSRASRGTRRRAWRQRPPPGRARQEAAAAARSTQHRTQRDEPGLRGSPANTKPPPPSGRDALRGQSDAAQSRPHRPGGCAGMLHAHACTFAGIASPLRVGSSDLAFRPSRTGRG